MKRTQKKRKLGWEKHDTSELIFFTHYLVRSARAFKRKTQYVSPGLYVVKFVVISVLH